MPSSRYYRFKIDDKKERAKKIKVLILCLFILIIISTLIWMIFLSPVFHVNDIKISNSDYLNSNDVEKNMKKIAPFGLGSNLLVLSEYRLKKELAVAFPEITDIIIKKRLFHTIAIDFKKRIQLGIWCRLKSDQLQTDYCFYFDKEGIMFAEAPQTEGSLILKIEDESRNNASLGDKVLNSEKINFLITLKNKIDENGKLRILEFKIKPNPSVDLEAVTDKNWLIYLDDKQDPILAANNLLTILKEAIRNSDNLEYVDLRIPSRIFYKLK